MRTSIALLSVFACIVVAAPTVDTYYPYLGPAVPVGDFIDPTVNGNGKGFVRLVEDPAVIPSSSNVTNNINVIQLSYLPDGMHVHFQTPFGIGGTPQVLWGESPDDLSSSSNGSTHTVDRTPPCSMISNVTQCSQFHHEVSITDLKPGKHYYYSIAGGNGTTPSEVLTFKTGRAAGQGGEFSVAIACDMGYTNALGTHKQMIQAVDDGASFVWLGGDLSYADDWYSGFLLCDLNVTDENYWPVCYNGSSTSLPGNIVPQQYNITLPVGESPNQGGPTGGDMSPVFEENWDLWQNWMSVLTKKVPQMVLPGNHDVTCAEFDGPGAAGPNPLTAYLNSNITNGTAEESELTYYSCPPSQRNFTAYSNRFRMPGPESGGNANFWYSFDFGLAHFISFDGETDFPSSPSYPFALDLSGNETHPMVNETYVTDAGPMGYVNGSYKVKESYEQYNFLKADLERVNRTKTPWVFAMAHRPMYSTGVSSYQAHMRSAFEQLFLDNNVDAYISGHAHWFERLFPMNNGSIDASAIVNNHTYLAKSSSMVHLVNGQAGNIESHSELEGSLLNITAVLNTVTYGFTKLTVFNETSAKFEFVSGDDGSIIDKLTLIKA